MVPPLVAALLLFSPQQPDTATFRDAATAELYAKARVRHIRQDQLVNDYSATGAAVKRMPVDQPPADTLAPVLNPGSVASSYSRALRSTTRPP